MNKASLKRHADFRQSAITLLKAHGAAVTLDDKDTIMLRINVKHVGPLDFTMFKGDGGRHLPKDELYSVFIRLAWDRQLDDKDGALHKRGVATINEVSRFDKMSDNGKWNIHFTKVEDAIAALEDRLDVIERLSL